MKLTTRHRYIAREMQGKALRTPAARVTDVQDEPEVFRRISAEITWGLTLNK